MKKHTFTFLTLGWTALCLPALPAEEAKQDKIPPAQEPAIPVAAKTFPKTFRSAHDKKTGEWNWNAVPKNDAFADFPSKGKKKEWKLGQDDEKRQALKQEISRLRKAAAWEIKAFPAAADFPGIPADGTPMVERTLQIDASIPGWHSTGLYALPGTEVTVKIPDNLKQSGDKSKGKRKAVYEVRIGCHTDKLNQEKHKSWSRCPELSFTQPLKTAETKITSPFGGLVYIQVPDGTDGKFPVTITQAVPAPSFVLGKTTPAEWKAQLESTTTPWGEIECPRLIVSLPLEQLKQVPDIQKMAEHLQKNMELQDWFIGWDKIPGKLKKPMRLVVDRQISAGAGHSGYPAMGTIGWGKPIANGDLITKGSWGIWHELGHNHQTPPYRLDGLGEVTVNLFSLLSQIKGCGRSPEESWGGLKHMDKALNEFFSGKETYNEMGKQHGLRLYLFAELIKGLGFEPFRAASLKYIESPYDAKTTPNEEKWNWLMVALSEASGKNLGPFFTAWRTPVTEEAKTKIAKLPTWLPAGDYPNNYIKK